MAGNVRTVTAARGGMAAAGGQAGAEGIRAAIPIRKHHPQVADPMLSPYVELGLAMQLLAQYAEGIGHLLQDRVGDVNEFLTAVQRDADGWPAIDRKIVSALPQRRRSENPLALLTPREREVLELMATGTSNQGIADKLVITTRAIEKYVSSIFDKLGIPSTRNDSRRVMAVLLYLRS
jgi:DNA-binding NarL/FixJ family response regulator